MSVTSARNESRSRTSASNLPSDSGLSKEAGSVSLLACSASSLATVVSSASAGSFGAWESEPSCPSNISGFLFSNEFSSIDSGRSSYFPVLAELGIVGASQSYTP